MKDVRIGNDISVIWSLYSDQKPFLLDGLKISVYLKGMYGKTKIEDYTIKDNEIHWTFFGKDQKHTGKYSLTLVVNEGAEGMVTTDVCDLVRLVSCTCQADGSDEDGVQTETIAVNSEVELLSGGFGRIDTALDPMSENAVSNAVITAEFGKVNEATSGLKTQMADDKAELMTNLEQVGVLAYEAAMRSSRNEQDKVDKDKVATINGKSLIGGDNIVIGGGIYEIKYDYLNGTPLSGEDIAFNKEVFDRLNNNEVSALYVTIIIDNNPTHIVADSFLYTQIPSDETYVSGVYLNFNSDSLLVFGLSKKTVGMLSTGQSVEMPISSNIVDDEMSDTSVNAVQNKVITEELNNKVDKVSGKQLSTEDFTTELKTRLEGMSSFDPTEINNKVNGLQTQIDTLVSGDTSTAIESFNEITNFLNGIEDTKSLEGIIAGIERQITNKQDTIADLDTIRSGAALGATALQRINYPQLEDNLIDSGFYHSPDGMLYRSDMEDSVQESLNKADSALQEHQSLAGYATESFVNGAISTAITNTINASY